MLEKTALEFAANDTQNLSYTFGEASRALRNKNPLSLEAAKISRSLRRVSRQIDTFVEKLDKEGLLKG